MMLYRCYPLAIGLLYGWIKLKIMMILCSIKHERDLFRWQLIWYTKTVQVWWSTSFKVFSSFPFNCWRKKYKKSTRWLKKVRGKGFLPSLKKFRFYAAFNALEISLQKTCEACAVSCLVLSHLVDGMRRCAPHQGLGNWKRYFPFVRFYRNYIAKSEQSQEPLFYNFGTSLVLL